MATPILYTINAFDATAAHDIAFAYSGNQAVKNKLTVKRVSDNGTVYEQTQTTYALKHALPADALTNGEYYSATVEVFDSLDASCGVSDAVNFYVFSTPTFAISGVENGGTVRNASLALSIEYAQAEDEPLSEYVIKLLSPSGTELKTSGTRFAATGLSYTLSGLEHNSAYKLIAIGKTLNGMSVSTGEISFTVSYARMGSMQKIVCENISEKGYIKLTSNVISITGRVTPEPPIYIDDDMLDITASGSRVDFDKGFSIYGDFLLGIAGVDLEPYTYIFTSDTGAGELTIYFNKRTYDGEEKYFFTATQTVGFFSQTATSELFDTTANNWLIWLKRKGGDLTISVTQGS